MTLAAANAEPRVEFTYSKPPNPTIVTGAASAVAQASATLNATVNPEGFEVSACYFEYGTSSFFGSSVPCSSAPGSGTSPVAVSALAAGLKPNTAYYFRIVATNSEGTSYGSESTFSTPPNPPALVTGGASAVAESTATLNATVDPEGGEVESCYFEYGSSPAYGSSAPCATLPGSGTSPVAVSASVALSANRNYHFRVVATNKGGTSRGADETLSTRAEEASFAFTGGEQKFVVPSGVFGVDVVAVGARGGSAGGAGGVGAQVDGEVSVTPGETLYVEVGGDGVVDGGGFNGGGGASGGAGGGGGASDVRTSPSSAGLSPDDRLLVAGGGGGSGVLGSVGAGAGGAAGRAGEEVAPNEGGGPGTQSGGGLGGQEHCASGGSGVLGVGGAGGYYDFSGGGGGGGYYGGGGGGAGCTTGGAGGGGGSSLVPAGGGVTLAAATAEPQVQIFYTEPTITSVTPDAGLEGGGTPVTLTGTNLATVTEVEFGSAPGVPANCSETECTATSPAGNGTVHVSASTAGATSAPEAGNQFTYVPLGPAPTIKKLSAKKGPAAGATPVTITGTGFTGVTAVKFGSVGAGDVTVVSPMSITVVSPAGTTGTVEVTVTTPNGTSAASARDRFKYEAPTVIAVSPSTGSKAGGTHVTVTGSGFAPGTTGTTFEFGGTSAGSVACASTTTCTMIAPAVKKVGAVDVKATVDEQASTKNAPADLFTYGP